jgi:hypothetical protein
MILKRISMHTDLGKEALKKRKNRDRMLLSAFHCAQTYQDGTTKSGQFKVLRTNTKIIRSFR